MLSSSTREDPTVHCILTGAQSAAHLTFTPLPTRPANKLTHTHTHRLNVEYEQKEPHTSCLTPTDILIHVGSFYIITSK